MKVPGLVGYTLLFYMMRIKGELGSLEENEPPSLWECRVTQIWMDLFTAFGFSFFWQEP